MDGSDIWGPRRQLRVPVRHLPGESTGSFVNRLAHAHGLELGDLLGRVGEGYRSVDARLPALAELYVNRAALENLAVLSGRAPHRLQWALPSLADRFLLPGGGPAGWGWPFTVKGGWLVGCCDACALARGVTEPAWRVWPDGWRVCLRHQRFTFGDRGQDPRVLRLEALPEVVRAHAGRRRLEQRFGPAGAELFADAFQIVGRWWERMPEMWSWTQRAWRVGWEAREGRTAALVICPEAVQLAGEMLRYEQRGERTRAARQAWLGGVQQLMDGWGLEGGKGWSELVQWLDRHSRPAPAPAGVGGAGRRRRRRALPLGHSRLAEPSGSLDERSCMT
ncbi:TniQ family protein [Streptomyces chrestomyceticus]|uniref:TniQ family protein n=1 Tax=Streptomyces chrestomyceticus TaxID=68185 RepID=UPI0036C5B729